MTTPDPIARFYPREIDDFLSPLAAMSDAQLQEVHDDILAIAAEHAGKLMVHLAQYPYHWQRPSWANFNPTSALTLQNRLVAEIDRRGKQLIIALFAGQPPHLAPKKGA